MTNFSEFHLIIDARCPREFAEDHIPGAVNFPVLNDEEYAEIGTLHRTDKLAAYKLGVEYALRNIARHLRDDFQNVTINQQILVYCFRGGKRSKLWLDALETMSYKPKKFQGGWKAYRRYVNASLIDVPKLYEYRVLSGATGCGKTRLLYALEKVGAQVLDLEEIAQHRGSVLGTLPGVQQPTQKLFDTQLLAKLLSFDRSKPIWLEAESKKIGNVQLPDALLSAMYGGTTLRVEAAMDQRVILWREDYRHFEEDPSAMVRCLTYLRPLVGGTEFALWETMASQRQMPALFERLMTHHYDPTYARSTLKNYPKIANSPIIGLVDLSPAALEQIALKLIDQYA